MLSRSDFIQKQILFIFTKYEDNVSFSNDNLVIKRSGEVIHKSSCHQILALYIVGNYTITSVLLDKAKKYGFSLIFMSINFRLSYVFINGLNGNTILRRKQYEYNGLEIAKYLIIRKLETHKINLLKLRDNDCCHCLNNIDYYINILSEDADYNLKIVMAFEGICAKEYFKNLFKSKNWKGRKPRVKLDEINVALDIGYTILFSFIESILSIYDFDIYVGVLHREFYKRKSLVCDLIEPFRYIIDYQTLKSFNLNQFKLDDFYSKSGIFYLRKDLYKNYARIYVEVIMKNKEEIFIFIQGYYRWFMKSNYTENPWR